MLEKEIAAIIYLIKEFELKEYFGEIPENAATPSVYYPVPEMEGGAHSLYANRNTFTWFIKIFDKDSASSFDIAKKIVRKVQSLRQKIPLYDKDGKPTGERFTIKEINARNIDTGTTQISIIWNTYERVLIPDVPKGNIYFDGLPVSEEEKEESEDGNKI